MKKNLATQELQILQQEIDSLQSEFDQFPRKAEVLSATCEEKIRDPDVLKYYFKVGASSREYTRHPRLT